MFVFVFVFVFILGLYDEEGDEAEEEEEEEGVLDILEKESPLLKGFFVAAEGKALGDMGVVVLLLLLALKLPG